MNAITARDAPPIPANPVYMLRTCSAGMTAYGGFAWPTEGYVEAPDWDPEPVCGGGLHGLLWGAGDVGHLAHRDETAKWLVVAIEADRTVDIDGKVKAPCGWVVFCGDRTGAVADLLARGADVSRCVYATLTGGDRATLTGGDYATLTSRYLDGRAGRHRTLCAECDGEQLKAGVAYRVADGKFVEVAR